MTNSIILLNACIHRVVILMWADTWKTLQEVCYRIVKHFQSSLASYVLLCNAGKIPLRQLVYRVLDLPPSMRPLVYDFGQLTTWTEEDYTKQIVLDHVSILICIDIIMSCMIMSFLGSRYHRVISRLSISPCHFSALNITMSFLGSWHHHVISQLSMLPCHYMCLFCDCDVTCSCDNFMVCHVGKLHVKLCVSSGCHVLSCVVLNITDALRTGHSCFAHTA